MSDYSTLGILPNASAEEVKRAHRRLVKELHPDRAGDASTDSLAKINAAYDRIKSGNPVLGGTRSAAHSPFTYPDFGDDGSTKKRRPDARTQDDRRADTAEAGSKAPRADDAFAKADARPEASYRYTGYDERRSAAEEALRAEMRKAEVRAAAERRARRDAEATPATEGPTRGSRVQEMGVSEDQKSAMQGALDRRMKQEAYKRVTELRGGVYPGPRQRIGTDRGDLPGFHAAEQITFEGRKMQIHLGSEAKNGRNIIAIPEIEMTGGATVRSGKGAVLFEVAAQQGRGIMQVDAKNSPFRNHQGLEVEVVFGSDRLKKRGAASKAWER